MGSNGVADLLQSFTVSDSLLLTLCVLDTDSVKLRSIRHVLVPVVVVTNGEATGSFALARCLALTLPLKEFGAFL